MQRRSKGVVQLIWVCPNCEGQNPGPQKTCQSCGAPQPENVQFQRASEEKIITDENIVQAAKAGADIHCGFCGTRNPANAITCSQCGGDLKEGVARKAGQVLQAAPPSPKVIICANCNFENKGTSTTCEQCGAPLPKQNVSQANVAGGKTSSPVVSKRKSPNWFLLGGIGIFFAVCCVAIVLLFVLPSKSVQGTVTNVYWKTSVPVQEVRAVNYSNERGSPPSNAYNVSCYNDSREVCEERVEDTGSGYGEVVEVCHTETEQYCSYTVDEWTTIQTYDLEGFDLRPVYADPSLASDQRTGSASEDFTVYFSTSEGQITYSPNSINEFQQFQIGSSWTIQLNAIGGVVNVER
ncbi:MAG: zinc ribbon domain-containing protein [Anaerolineales bacterium]|nr:zinc ribbon domain-containing protein [Anaerolineales bacterium]